MGDRRLQPFTKRFQHFNSMNKTFLCASFLLFLATSGHGEPVKPNLKVALCTGDYGMWAQDRVPMIEQAVAKSSPDAKVSWEANQSYNMTRMLEDANWLDRFDCVVIGDVGIGQLTPRAQTNLRAWVQKGGGLVWVNQAKSTLPFSGAEDAVPMPLKTVLPVQYPDFSKVAPDAKTYASSAPFFAGIDFTALTDEGARKGLDQLLVERSFGKGRVLLLSGAFTRGYKNTGYAQYAPVPGGWADFPGLGEVWTRVLNRAGQSAPRRAQSLAAVDAAFVPSTLGAKVSVDARQKVDEIRAADFSIVALQQLYNEDGGAGEDLFLALNPRDWFDRRSQEVMPNTKGVKADKPAFFRDYNIKGIYMADNSYGSYGQWNDAKYAEQEQKAVDAAKQYGSTIPFFQAGNEPPLDENYVKFHKRFVGDVLKQAPNYQVVGPNKAFNLFGVNPKEMQFYIDSCGSTTDVLNWHTYAQPPSTTLAEARYWSDKATGKLRTPGQARVMFTENDAWNQGDSQFNYLLERAFTFLPEKRIIANFQYCMRPRSEGGTYRFGVLQPDGEMEANYNGYWIWKDLRGDMVSSTLQSAASSASDTVRVQASRSKDGNTVTTVVYMSAPVYSATTGKPDSKNQLFNKAHVNVSVQLPPGKWRLTQNRASWNKRATLPTPQTFQNTARIPVDLNPFEAVALTWTRA